MDVLFIKILNMSISASWLVLAVILLRFLLKKAPRWIHVALWALVAVRLICPFSIESVLSLLPSAQTIPQSIVYDQTPVIDSGVTVIDQAVNTTMADSLTPEAGASVNPVQVHLFVQENIWCLGMAVMFAYAALSYFRLRRKVSASVVLDNGVRICDYIDTPFILGIFSPKIYLPSSMEPDSASHVLAHERAHIARKDHWWKPFGYLLLSIHWFNPVLWLAYILLCRDIELACDEKVIRDMALPQKKAYSEALLKCSVNRRHIAACPLAFGEVGVKERVKTVLNYKKPAFRIVLVAVLALIVTAICFLTDPVEEADVLEFFYNHIYEQEKDRRTPEEIHVVDAKDGYALVYCNGMGPYLKLFQYEIADGEPRITAYCAGSYNISGCISVNHVESDGKHVYYGTVSGSHYDPAEPMAEKFEWRKLRLTDENGKSLEQDMENAYGFLVVLDAPLADFQVVSDQGVVLDYASYLSQGYALDEQDLISANAATDIFGEIYRVEKVVYRNPMLSFHMTEQNAPLFNLTQGHYLQIQDGTEQWEILGELTQVDLTDKNIDSWFFGEELGMEDNLTLAQLLENNRSAWILSVPSPDNANSRQFYLLLWQYSGDIYLAQGHALSNVYPLHDSVLDASCSVNWLFRLTPVDADSPYRWTSTVEPGDIQKAWAYPYADAAYSHTIEGSRLDEVLGILNGVKAHEIVAKKAAEIGDPLWDYDSTVVYFYLTDGMTAWLRYLDNSVRIGISSNSDIHKASGYWVVENAELTRWMENLANGGTWMLSDENRDEIRQLLRQEHIQFFDPWEYDDRLFVGCAYDNGRGLGVACFEKVAYGYKLHMVLRDEDVKPCASGSELYYCDYNQYRIFLILNQSVTGMEWAGAYEASYAIDTHPGLIVEYFPQNLGSMYRFCYGANATTMFMDWDNRTHVQVPDYSEDIFADPNDPFRVCTNIKPDQVEYIWSSELIDAEDGYHQAVADDLSASETAQLLDLLKNLPKEAFEASEFAAVNYKMLDIFFRNYTGQKEITPTLSLKLHENEVYYQFAYNGVNIGQSWKIHSPELAQFVDSFFAEDRSKWHRFAPIPKMDGEISCDFEGMEVYVPKLVTFEYLVTEEGIRFKPEKEEGYILVRYCDIAFDYTTLGKRTFSGIYGNMPGIQVCEGTEEIWSFTEVMVTNPVWYVEKPDVDAMPSMNVRFVNEDKASWVEEYDDQITWILMGLRIHVNG